MLILWGMTNPNGVKQYVKRPIPVEAVQYFGDNFDEILAFAGAAVRMRVGVLEVITLEGIMGAPKGAYIIKGIKGEFYPCAQDIFEESYMEFHGEQGVTEDVPALPPGFDAKHLPSQPTQETVPMKGARTAQTPSVGRVAHYVAYGTPNGEFKPAHRAAIITEVHPDHANKVRLCIFNPTGLFFSDWLMLDESGTQGGTWHWPERV